MALRVLSPALGPGFHHHLCLAAWRYQIGFDGLECVLAVVPCLQAATVGAGRGRGFRLAALGLGRVGLQLLVGLPLACNVLQLALWNRFSLRGPYLSSIKAAPPVDGKANEWHLSHYASIARGGAGLVIVEATVKRLRSRMGVLGGRATVNGKVVVDGTMTFALGSE